jgi:type II secretory pathway pseudopilin PulG
MRVLPIVAILALSVLPQATYAKEKAIAEKPLRAPTTQIYSAAESEAAGKAARQKADEQQSAWDKKTKSITRGICSGC